MLILMYILYTGWWLTYPSEKWSSSVGMMIPNIWKNKTCSKPPTRYIIYIYIHIHIGRINIHKSHFGVHHFTGLWPMPSKFTNLLNSLQWPPVTCLQKLSRKFFTDLVMEDVHKKRNIRENPKSIYPLVNIQKAMENGHRNSGFSH